MLLLCLILLKWYVIFGKKYVYVLLFLINILFLLFLKLVVCNYVVLLVLYV